MTMVKETRLVFEISDICNVRIICAHCRGQVLYSLVDRFPGPEFCPLCHEPWVLPEGQPKVAYKHLQDLLAAIKFFKDGPTKNQTQYWKLNLELDGEEVGG